MPLNAWTIPTFKEIGNRWGHFIQVDNDTLKEISYEKGRILIATEVQTKIEGVLDLVVGNIKYKVRVQEEESFRSIQPSKKFFSVDSLLLGEEEEDDVDRKDAEKDSAIRGQVDMDEQLEKEVIERTVMTGDKERQTWVGMQQEIIADNSVLLGNVIYQQSQHSNQLNNLLGDDCIQVAKGKENEVSSGGGSRLAIKRMETIMEEEVESFVGETPRNEVNNQLEPFEINENSNHKEFPEEYWKVTIEHNQREPFKQQHVPKVQTARQKRARLRKDIRDICDSLDEGTQVGEVWEDVSVHSDSIDSEDILRRNNFIFQGFEEELQSQTAMGVRLGIEFSEEDTMVMSKMIKEDANRYALLSRSKSKC